MAYALNVNAHVFALWKYTISDLKSFSTVVWKLNRAHLHLIRRCSLSIDVLQLYDKFQSLCICTLWNNASSHLCIDVIDILCSSYHLWFSLLTETSFDASRFSMLVFSVSRDYWWYECSCYHRAQGLFNLVGLNPWIHFQETTFWGISVLRKYRQCQEKHVCLSLQDKLDEK